VKHGNSAVLCLDHPQRSTHVTSWKGILSVFRLLKTVRSLRKRHIHYRATEPARVVAAYRSMSEDEFDAINGPQEWQNTRLIPSVVESLQLQDPLLAVDLGCGSGQSSQVLAAQLQPGSRLLAYDICERLLSRASSRTYHDCVGGPLQVSFINQSIAQPLHYPEGRRLEGASVGLVHAAGVVGHHLNKADVLSMASEIARVLAPAGYAVLDAGPALPRESLHAILSAQGFELRDTLRAIPGSHHVLVFQRRSDITARRIA